MAFGKVGRPPKIMQNDVSKNEILVSAVERYGQTIAQLDVSAVVPFSQFASVDMIFPKLGLMIRREFGAYLGYQWGYGAIRETPHPNALASKTADVNLQIIFQKSMTEAFLSENLDSFKRIYKYLQREMSIFTGALEEEY